MLRIDGNKIYFSSGRNITANEGIIGISPELELSEGYDGNLYIDSGSSFDLSKEDAIELADHMIERWVMLKEKLSK